MIHDKFRKQYRIPQGSSRLRQQIALEAARRLIQGSKFGHDDGGDEPGDETEGTLDWLGDVSASDFYLAKRKAAAVLGHRVRQGDLPSDGEIREQVITLVRSGSAALEDQAPIPDAPGLEEVKVPAMADLLDRFTVYKLRLQPLETVKQNPKYHPEGDALYHSLQVFELARQVRPYDEEFLLAALLHDVGKAVDTKDHAAIAVESLRGSVTSRTLWLIEHHMDLLRAKEKPLDARLRREIDTSEYLDDLKLLRSLDDAGRVAGQPVGTIDEALDYIRGLEQEEYLSA